MLELLVVVLRFLEVRSGAKHQEQVVCTVVLRHILQIVSQTLGVQDLFLVFVGVWGLTEEVRGPEGRGARRLRGTWPDVALRGVKGGLHVIHHDIKRRVVKVVENVAEHLCLSSKVLVHRSPYKFHPSVLKSQSAVFRLNIKDKHSFNARFG